MDWYFQQRRFLKRRFGERWQFMAGLLAATSARTQLIISWNWSLAIYEAVIRGQEPNLSMLLPCHRLNVRRVLNGEPLSGEKVRRFYANLCGDLDVVTIDTWMLKLWKIDCGTHGYPHPAMYRRLERVFQRWAKSQGLRPAQMQAILWNYVRVKSGEKPTGFVSIEEKEAAPF